MKAAVAGALVRDVPPELLLRSPHLRSFVGKHTARDKNGDASNIAVRPPWRN